MKIHSLIFQPPMNQSFSSVQDKVILIPKSPFQDAISYQHYKKQGSITCDYKDRLQKNFQSLFPVKRSKRLKNLYQENSNNKMIKSISTINTLQSLKTLKAISTKKCPEVIDEYSGLYTSFGLNKSRNGSFYDSEVTRATNNQTKEDQANGYILRKRLSTKQIYNNNAQRERKAEREFKVEPSQFVPCLFMKGDSNKVMLFFHANAQDLVSVQPFVEMLRNQTEYNILAVQYRGYSILKGQSLEQNIQRDGKRVFEYLLQKGLLAEDVIFCGRSIGAGVALGCLQDRKVHSLILLSPFVSLRKLVGQLTEASCLGSLVHDSYNNFENISQIKSPTLIIHGMKDMLIPYHHSLGLIGQCQSFCRLKLVEHMTHSKFHLKFDFINHMKSFHDDIKELQQKNNLQ